MKNRKNEKGARLGGTSASSVIADNQQAEEALREAEQKYRDIFENAGEGIFQSTPAGRYIAANPALARMHGFDSPEELISSLRDISLQVYADPARREEFKSLLEEHGVVRGFEHLVSRKDGSKIWVSVNARAVRDERGRVLYYEGTTQDIDERKRAEARSAAFATLARKLSGARAQLDAGRIIALTAGDLFGWDSCNLDLYDADRDLIHPMLNVDTIDGKQTDVTALISDREPTPRSKRVIAHGAELLLREEPIRFDEDSVPFGDKSRPSASIMTVPIRHASSVIGLLSIQSYTTHSYDSAALADLQALADHCGEALNRIQAEESLSESEERYRDLVESTHDLVQSITPDGHFVFANRVWFETLGYTKEELPQLTITDIIHPESLAHCRELFARVMTGESVAGVEAKFLTNDGREIFVEGSASPRFHEGCVTATHGFFRDVTQRKLVEKELSRSEEQYRALVEQAPDAIFISDPGLHFIDLNALACELGGYTKDETLRMSILDFMAPEDIVSAPLKLNELREGKTVVAERRLRRKDGTLVPVEVSSKILSDGRLQAIVRDITERKQIEEALRESEERFRQLSEAAFEAIIFHDQGTILEVNQSFCRMYGYERAEVIGNSVLDLTLPEFREPLLQRVRSGGTSPYEGLALRKDGTIFTAELAAKPIHYQGRVVRVAAIRNITEQKRNERRQAAQYAVTRVLAESATLAEATPRLLQVICESLRWKMGEFWRVGDGPNVLRCVETWHVPELDATAFIEASRQTLLVPGAGLPGRVWQSGQPAWIPDILTDSGFARAAIADNLGLRGAVAFPILLENQTLGVLLFFSRRAPEVDENLLKMMSAIGSQIGQFTERKQADEALKKSEQDFRNLFEQAHDAIIVFNPEHEIVLDVNERACELYGFTRSEFIGMSLEAISKDVVRGKSEIGKTQERGAYLNFETVQYRKDGTEMFLEINASTILYQGQLVILSINRDVTERKRADEKLQNSEKYFRSLIENASDLITVADGNGIIRYESPSLERMLGYKPEERIGRSVFELLHPDDLPFAKRHFAKGMQNPGTVHIMESRFQHKDGSWHLVETTGINLLDDPVVAGIVVNSRDITERRRAEEARRESEERYRDLVENSRELICTHDLDGRVLSANRAAAEALGYDSNELLEGKNIRDILAPEVRDEFEPYMASLRERGATSGIMLVETSTGERRIWEYYNSLRSEGVATPIVRGMARDITERKRAEEALLASERKYRDIFTLAPVGIYQSLRDGTLITANKALAKMLGYASVDELLRVKLGSGVYFAEDEREKLIREYEGLGYAVDLHMQWKRKDGSPICVQLSAHAIKGPNGETEYFEGFVRDITERKRAEMERDVISEVIQSVNLTSDLDELLTQVHQSLKRVLYAENCSVALFDKQTGLFEAPLFVDLLEANPFPMALSKNCTSKVFSSGQPLLMNEAILAGLLDRGEVKLIGRPSPSFLAVPLMTPTETIGVIVVQHYEKDNVYSQRDVEFLSAVAAQMALAIERKRAQEELHESEERYRDLVENSREFVCTHDLNGVILSANRAASEVLGYDLNDLCGKKNYRDLLVPEVRDQFDDYLARLRRDGVASGLTLVQTSSGERRILEYHNTVRTEGVATPIVRGMARDITEQRRAEKAMSDLRHELELTMNSMEEGVHRVDMQGNIAFENPASARMLGWEVAELLGKPAHLTMHHTRQDGTPYPKEECPIYATLRDGLTRQVADEVFWRRDGTSFPVEYLTASMRNDRNEIVAVVVTFRDITERKRAEESLQLFRNLIDRSNDAIEVIDPITLRFIDCNESAYRALGYTREEFLALTVFDIDPVVDRSSIAQLDEKIKESGFATLESVHLRKDGTTFPVEINVKIVRLERDYRLAVVRDITARTQAEEALRVSEERYRELFENAKDAIYVHDLSGRYVSINRAAEQLSGFSREQIVGKHFSNFVSPRDLKQARTNLCRKLDVENETTYEVDVVHRDGRRIPVEVSSRVLHEKGVAVGIQGTARDITDRKRAQDALRIYSQRLIEAQEAERQKIARELHDEIGQVLTAVRINLQSVQRSCETADRVPRLDESIAIVDEALGSVRELSIELRPSLLDDLGLSAALRWYVDRYAQRTGIIAEVLDGFEEDGRLARDFETACFRIAQEALTNVARHAQAGSVSVQLERTRERMLLTIIDDGIGFDIDKLRKSASPASALGLRGMEERALALGGQLEIDSGLERGTRIRATFPLKRK